MGRNNKRILFIAVFVVTAMLSISSCTTQNPPVDTTTGATRSAAN
ncbi:MAG: hypothetical protein PHH37_09960 [Paludibacter sp.]|nr:hypothetical protein [Paludibacter sp.]